MTSEPLRFEGPNGVMIVDREAGSVVIEGEVFLDALTATDYTRTGPTHCSCGHVCPESSTD